MKVEASIVIEFFENAKFLMSGINETIRMGEDDFHYCVQEQINDIAKAFDTFKVMNLTPVTKIEKPKHDYIKHYEKHCVFANNGVNINNGQSDNLKIYKAELYLHIKKVLRDEIKADVLSEVPNEQLTNWIDTYTIFNGSKFEKMVTSNEYWHSSIAVVKDIAEEIISQRKKAPQLRLFTDEFEGKNVPKSQF